MILRPFLPFSFDQAEQRLFLEKRVGLEIILYLPNPDARIGIVLTSGRLVSAGIEFAPTETTSQLCILV